MSNEAKFIPGLIVKAPHDNAPEYVKGKLSFKVEEMLGWLQDLHAAGEQWANGEIKVSQNGKWYAAVDNWKPEGGKPQGQRQESPVPRREAPPRDFDDDSNIPF